jgi:hypothetical protein
MEQQIKEKGVEVYSNSSKVLRLYHLFLIESHNRAIGQTYFYQETTALVDAYEKVRKYNHEIEPFDLPPIVLPPLEIDLNDKKLLDSDNLEWYNVDLTGLSEDGEEKCIGFGLRYKEGLQPERSERRVEELHSSSGAE